MDKRTAVEAANRFLKELMSLGIRVERCILYGSCASSSAREDSDIDLIVVSGDFADKGYWERIDILSKAIYASKAPIEAVAFSPVEYARNDRAVLKFALDGEVIFAA